MKTNLTVNLDIDVVFFVSSRYWTESAEVFKAVTDSVSYITKPFINCSLSELVIRQHLIAAEKDLDSLPDSTFAIFVPMSGGTQSWILQAADKFQYVVVSALYASHREFLAAALMLERNAAPAVMDTFSVLKRDHRKVYLALSSTEIYTIWKCAQAVYRVSHSRLLLIGAPEPWVVSCCRDFSLFQSKLGISILQRPLEELYQIYYKISREAGKEAIAQLLKSAAAIVEPAENDVSEAGKLYKAISVMMDEYKADALALACFQLLNDIHTTGCLALSRLNDSKCWIGACEGDLDAAVTLMLAKALIEKPAFMANPNLQLDGTVNFVHCSAPLCIGEERSSFRLRNHHESGIGVSPEVTMDSGQLVTVLRVGNSLQTLSVCSGVTLEPVQEKTCRTQLHVKLDDSRKFIECSLGCHSVVLFGDYLDLFVALGEMLELEVLS